MDDENKIPEPAQAPEPAQPATPADARDLAQEAVPDQPAASMGETQPVQPAAAQPQADPAAAQPTQPYAAPQQPQQPYAQQPAQPYAAAQQPVPPYGAPQQPGQPYYQPGQQPVQPYAPQSNGKALGALICGILAIVFSWLPLVGIILGIVAIVLSVKAVKEGGKDGKATGGKACGIAGIVLSVFAFIVWMVLGCATLAIIDEYEASGGDIVTDIQNDLEASGSLDDSDSSDADTAEAEAEAAAMEAVDEALSVLRDVNDADIQELAAAFDEGFAEGAGFGMAEMGVDPVMFAEWLIGDLDYTVEEAYIFNDGTGWVDVTVTIRDVSAFATTFDDEVDAFMETEEYQNMTDEAALKAKLGELLLSAMDKTTGTTEDYLMIDVVEKGGTWEVDPDSLESEMEYLFSF